MTSLNQCIGMTALTAVCSLLASACSAENASIDRQSAVTGNPNEAAETPSDDEQQQPTQEQPESADEGEESEESPSTCSSQQTVVDGWPTYANGHFSFQVPPSYLVDHVGEVPTRLLSEFKNNADPAVSKYVAETAVGHSPSAYWFVVRVGEIAAPGTAEDGVAAFSKYPRGLPPADRNYGECGLVDLDVTTYACDPAVEAAIACWWQHGYAYHWVRHLYRGGRTYEMRCAGIMVEDIDAICAKALASLNIRD